MKRSARRRTWQPRPAQARAQSRDEQEWTWRIPVMNTWARRYPRRLKARLPLLAFPVIEGAIRPTDITEAVHLAVAPRELGEHSELAGIRVFGDLRRHLGADREVAQLRLRRVDDLVGGL